MADTNRRVQPPILHRSESLSEIELGGDIDHRRDAMGLHQSNTDSGLLKYSSDRKSSECGRYGVESF
jgi:hypothetical protein